MTPEFSHRVTRDDIPHDGLTVELSADAAERAALAERFDLIALQSLHARFAVKAVAGGPMLRVEGVVEGAALQRCVLTLEPVPAAIREEVAVDFVPPGAVPTGLEIGLEDEDPPEPLEDGGVDLGELAAQVFGVALDPFPRAEGAVLARPDPREGEPGGVGWTVNQPSGPFAGLAALAGRDEDA